MNININKPSEPKASFSGIASMCEEVPYPNVQRLVYERYILVFAEYNIEITLWFL